MEQETDRRKEAVKTAVEEERKRSEVSLVPVPPPYTQGVVSRTFLAS